MSESNLLSPSPFFAGSPWHMMRRMQEDMERMFSQVLGGGAFGITPTMGGWSPSMDISEDAKEWRIEAELPGVDPDNVDVQVRDQSLVIRAELRPSVEEEREDERGRRYYRQERQFGYFEQVLPLPENVNEDAISCEFQNGVLRVHVPKTEQAQQPGRRIPIQTEAAQQTQLGQGKAAQQTQRETAGAPPAQQAPASASRSERAMHEEEEEEEARETAGRQRR